MLFLTFKTSDSCMGPEVLIVDDDRLDGRDIRHVVVGGPTGWPLAFLVTFIQ